MLILTLNAILVFDFTSHLPGSRLFHVPNPIRVKDLLSSMEQSFLDFFEESNADSYSATTAKSPMINCRIL